MKSLVRSLCAVIIGIFLSVSLNAQTVEQYMQRAEVLSKKDTRQAFKIFQNAIQLSRQNKQWYQYFIAVNRVASLKDVLAEEEVDITFTQLKESVVLLNNIKPDSNIAQFHYHVAIFYDEYSYETDLPIDHFKASIKIWSDLKGELNKEVAASYHGLGDVYKYKKADFEEAEKCYEKALKIREQIHFDDARILTSNYYNLALTNRSQSDYEKALAYGIRALNMTEQLDNAIYSEMSNAMVANIYRDMDESALARKYYLNAIALNRKTNDQGNLAWYYQGMGDLSKNLGDLIKGSQDVSKKDSLYADALSYFKKAYTIYKKKSDRRSLVYLLQIMNETYAFKNDASSFYRTFHELFRELKSLDMPTNRLAAYGYMGAANFHFRRTGYDSALFYYQKALRSAVPVFTSSDPAMNPSESMIDVNYYVFDILKGKAGVLNSLFMKTHERSYFEQSLQCLFLAEKLMSVQRNSLDMEDSKWQLLETNYAIYESILSTLYEGLMVYGDSKLLDQAFKYFEQSKVRSLADALLETERTRNVSSQDSLFRSHAELKRKLFGVKDQLAGELETSPSSPKVSQLREEVVKYDREIQKYKSAIEEKFPGYFNARYGYKTPSLKMIQEIINDEGRIIVEYFWGNESVYAICILPGEVVFKQIGTPDSIQHMITELLDNFGDETHSSIDINAFTRYTASAHKLYLLLLQPFYSQLQGKTRLQIIPDGMISQIPFEVLLEEEAHAGSVNYRSLHYLLRTHTIGYMYSSAGLVHSIGKALRKPTLLAFGYTGGQALRASASPLIELAGAEKELEILAGHFGHGKFLEGDEATEANFKMLAPDFDILHLAIHGKGEVQKKFTASLFFGGDLDSLEDGELHAYELYGLKLKARMAVLTSCEGGLGKDFKGEGMLSMASAFAYSGCENILMSLWKVNDQASISLMDDFYELLLGQARIDDALRQAKLNYLATADEISADPVIWAPMVAYGSLGEVFEDNKSRTVWITLVIAILVGTVLLLYLKKKNGV